jgi:hypothetical protein
MQEANNSTGISKRAFADAIGVTPGRVSQMIGAGLPVTAAGRIDLERGKAWVSENIDANRRRVAPGAVQPRNASRNLLDASQAEIARLKAAQLGGNLIDRVATLQAIEGRARFEREAWIGWVNRAAPEIASATNADLQSVVAVLDRLVRDHLANLAQTPLEIEGDRSAAA